VHARCGAGTIGVNGSGMIPVFGAVGFGDAVAGCPLSTACAPADIGAASNGREIKEIRRVIEGRMAIMLEGICRIDAFGQAEAGGPDRSERRRASPAKAKTGSQGSESTSEVPAAA
jgi:hypothetical protein